jgi:hypothetical protein
MDKGLMESRSESEKLIRAVTPEESPLYNGFED